MREDEQETTIPYARRGAFTRKKLLAYVTIVGKAAKAISP